MSCPLRKLVTAFRGRYMRASSISREGLNLAPFSIILTSTLVGRRAGGTAVDGAIGALARSESPGDCRALPAGIGSLPSSSLRHQCIQITRWVRNIRFSYMADVRQVTL